MMITRREMGGTLAAGLTTLFSKSSGALRRAKVPQVQQDAQSRMQDKPSVRVETLLRAPLPEMPNPEARMITLTVAPGATSSPHKHTGPVFAFLLEGEIENQVDPDPPRKYKAGEFFYEPMMHVHRSLRNLSGTKTAKLLIFEVGEKGKEFTIGAK